MSSKIDERIVGMKFNGDQFAKGVADTSSVLEKLKRALNMGDATRGMNDLNVATRNFSLANLAQGVADITSKFGAMGIVGITALANIANRAVDAGLAMARSLTIDPIKAGLAEYELKMGSIQTILSNTARYGTQLPEVTANLDALNEYADKTIYNFGDMTKNIGLFTNAGLQVGEATSLIKGFSNEAAASGTSSQGAAGAAYQLSQALSAGTIRLMDWRSLQNVGMGNKNMQNGIIEIAEAMGQFNEDTTSAEEASKNFNGSLEKNWLSADVMSNYLKIMAGDMDAAAMSAMGLSDAQIASFQAQQKMSEEAATKVRTFTQLVGTMQESVGSGWSETFDILIGDFNQATELWTAVNNELGGIVGKMSEERNNLLRGFVKMGGRDTLIEAFSNIWDAVRMFIMPIKSAFQEIFPPITIHTLLVFAENFRKFSESLKPSAETMKALKRIFMGVFAVLDIGWMVIKQVWGLFRDLFGVVSEGSGGFLEFAAGIGDWLVKARDAIRDGEALGNIFKWLGEVLSWPIKKLQELGAWTMNTVGTWDFAKAWEAVAKAFKAVGDFLAPVWEELGNFFRDAKKNIGDFFSGLDFNFLVGLMNLGALGAIGFGLKKAFDIFRDGGIMGLIFGKKDEDKKGIVDTIKEVFGAITDTFSELQNTLKAGSLMTIAVAIGILTAAVIALSFVDTEKLFIALGAMTVMFGQLAAMIVAIDKLTKTVNAGKMVATAIALSILAGAMILMSTAILILSTMDWVELARGLTGLAVGLGILVGTLKVLDSVKQSMYQSAGAIFVISVAMLLLASALKIYATMSWDEIGRGLTALVGSLGLVVAAMKLAELAKGGVADVFVISSAMMVLGAALLVMAKMSWDEIGRAMATLAGSLLLMVGAIAILSTLPNTPVGAATMIAMSVAMVILTVALKEFAKFSWDEIGRALVMMAGSLAILAGAMALMGIPLVSLGGLALFVVAAGMMMLAPALALLGTMSWDAIGRGLAMLAASLGILAVGGLLLIPASVGFLLLGAAILLIGAGLLMAGQAIALFTAGFAALVALAIMGAPAIKTALETIASAIPAMMAAFAQGIIDFALVIASGATQFTAAMSTLLMSMLMAINMNAPLILDTIWNLIVMMVEKIKIGVPYFVDAAFTIMIAFLNGIAQKLPDLITAAANVIVAFLNGLAENLQKIIDAGIKLVIKFIDGVAQGIRDNSAAFNRAGSNLFKAIVEGVSSAIENGGNLLRWAGQRIGNAIIEGAKNALGINSPSKVFRDYIMGSVGEGIDKGAKNQLLSAERAGKGIGESVISGTQKAISAIGSAVATNMDFNPSIKPILDLSNLEKNSALIGGLLTPPTLKVDDSYAYAASIATAQREFEESRSYNDDGDAPTGDSYTFIQNNTSPKALSAAEIYRQTNNQLSVVKKGQPTSA